MDTIEEIERLFQPTKLTIRIVNETYILPNDFLNLYIEDQKTRTRDPWLYNDMSHYLAKKLKGGSTVTSLEVVNACTESLGEVLDYHNAVRIGVKGKGYNFKSKERLPMYRRIIVGCASGVREISRVSERH